MCRGGAPMLLVRRDPSFVVSISDRCRRGRGVYVVLDPSLRIWHAFVRLRLSQC